MRSRPTGLTFEYALKFVAQSLTLALIGSIGFCRSLDRDLDICKRVEISERFRLLVVLVALTGLTMTFAHLGWLLVVERWVNPVDLALSVKGSAVSRALGIIRDFSVALGVSYLMIAIASPSNLPGSETQSRKVFDTL